MYFYKKIFSRFLKKNGDFFIKIEKILGFPPNDIRFYEEAFTHPSVRPSQGDSHISYERLEFLGDAILGAVIAHYLFKEAPLKDEGYLTKMRAKMVQRNYLNQVGKQLKLQKLLKTENKAFQLSENLYGNLFEALVGAIYLDKGYKKASEFIGRVLIDSHLSMKDWEGKIISHKSLMVEWCQKHRKTLAFDTQEDKEYNSNTRYFLSNLVVDGKIFAKGRDTSKKRAEEKAAKRAFFRIKQKQTQRKTERNTKK